MEGSIAEYNVVSVRSYSIEARNTSFLKGKILDITKSLPSQLNSFSVRINTENPSLGSPLFQLGMQTRGRSQAIFGSTHKPSLAASPTLSQRRETEISLSLQLQLESHFIIISMVFLFLHIDLGLLHFPAVFGLP